ncbi:hypothetical protein K1719_037923 [Acacia pycnantha]|nr:hypothetical protein K1719_037923 [Acacia pycnantha]
MEVLAAIAGEIAKLTVIPIGNQVDYLIFYKENLKELKEHLEELNTRKVRIEHDIEAERRNGRETEADVVRWKKIVEETLEEVEKLYKDEPHASVRCWKWSFPNLKSRHQLGRKAKKMTFTIDDLKEKGKFDGRVGYVLTSSNANLIFATRGSEKLESRNSLKKEVMLSLTDPKVRKVGIYGLPMVGKTTLAKEVAKHVKDDQLFDKVAMATISQTLDVKRVQDEIAYQLGFPLDEITSIGRANQLCARIKMEKNILIILDDLWEKIDLDKLGIPPERNETYQGCKLLLTSRGSDVLDMNETHKKLSLEPVNIEESWSLFEDMIGAAIEDAGLKHIANQVLERCAGMPVMIVSIAKYLKYNKNIHCWKDVLDNLKRLDHGYVHGDVFPAFEFTYQRLKDDEMKKVFLLCGVFGPMSVSDLLKYVIGLGILKHKDTVEYARNRLYRIIDELKASCLLLEDDASETDVIKMHDLVREVAVSIAQNKEHVFVLKRNGKMQDWLSKGSPERFTQILLKPCFLHELPSKLDCPNLKFFHLQCIDNCTLKIPDSFFEGMGSLEALDLTGLIISSLPRSLVSLSKLKTLCLDQCRLKHLTGIGALKNLEILSFIDSSMEEFPSEIEQLAHLRMLDLSDSGIGIMPPNILSKLTKIEELYMGNTSIKWEEENSAMKNMKNVLLDLEGKGFPQLKHLHIQNNGQVQHIIDTTERNETRVLFPELETLGLLNLNNLEKICHGSLPVNSFCKLSIIKIENCDQLVYLLTVLMVKALSQLDKIQVSRCNSMKMILYIENADSSITTDEKIEFKSLRSLSIDHLPGIHDFCSNEFTSCVTTTSLFNGSKVSFCSLETLKLSSVNLERIWDDGDLCAANCFLNLANLTVEDCRSLKHLFSSSVVGSLLKLKHLEISKCEMMEEIIAPKGINITTLEEVRFSKLETMVIKDMKSLKKVWHFQFEGLKSLEVSNCGKLVNIFPSDMQGTFGNLETLKVNDCDSVEAIFQLTAKEIHSEDETMTQVSQLKKLHLLGLPKLKQIWSRDAHGANLRFHDLQLVMFSSFNHLEFSEYPELKEIWYSQVGQKIFCNLKHLAVRKCTFLSNTLFSSILLQLLYTLEELEVAECDLLEAVFDVKALNDTTMESKGVSGLKKLTLSGLPNLKHIWNKEAEEIISFGNLQILKVDECPNLKYVFSSSLCQDLRQIEELNIESCGVEQIVASEEGLEELKFHFPLLRSLCLIKLTHLNDFYPKRYTLECPSLKALNISQCESLQIFAFGHLDSYQLNEVCGDLLIQQALFHIEKVPENLEEISLTEKDAMMILNGNYERKFFQRTEKLRLQYFQETPMKFSNVLIQKFPATITLVACCSYFKTLFPSGEIGHCSIQSPAQIKTLRLFLLEKLEHIWNDNSALDTLVPNLEHFSVGECCRLVRLAPTLTSFTSLITLAVVDCNGLMDFMSSFTAKSLVQLTHMTVRNCRMLGEVVMSNEGGPEEEIIFKSLKYLELTCLPCFKSFCFEKHTFIFPSLVKLKVTGCHKMQNFSSGTSVAPFLKLVEVENGKKCWKGDLKTTINHLFLEKTNENLNMDTTEASSSKEQVGESKPNQIADIGKQDTQKNEASSSIERPLAQVTQNAYSPSTNQDTEPIGLARGTQEMGENIERPSVEAAKGTGVYDADIGKQEIHKLPSESYDTQQNKRASSNQVTGFVKATQEMGENIERPSVDAAKIVLSPRRIYDTDVNETIEKPLIQTSQHEQRPVAGQDIEESHESKTCPNEESFNHPKTLLTRDKKENIHDTMDKPLIQTDQDAEKLATIQNTEESHDSYAGTQKICNTIKKASISTAEDVSNSTMIPKAAIDPSPSQAPEPVISPTEKLNIYRNYKGMIDIPKQNMPYLEAGVNRHPQVLDWLNTKRRRVFASSTFSLFAEVTCILRTTRKGHLTEDDRSYIRECCTVLGVVGFDVSWLNYVHKCIEECGDAEDIKRRVKETKGQASSLEAQIESMKKELAFVKESLVLLVDKARNLDDFIES